MPPDKGSSLIRRSFQCALLAKPEITHNCCDIPIAEQDRHLLNTLRYHFTDGNQSEQRKAQLLNESTEPPKRTRKLGPRRAQAKQVTQEKLVAAARKLFATQGYHASTLRQIASAAGIGLATVFSHIKDKRDLIYLIFNADLAEMAGKSIASVKPWQSFNEKMLAIIEPVLRLFASEVTLARILLSESFLDSPGPHYESYLRTRSQALGGIQQAVKVAKEAGEIQCLESEEMIVNTLYFAFSGFTRWWIALPNPDWRSGQERFARVLSILLQGLQPAAKVKIPASRPVRRRTAKRASTSR